MSAPRPLEESLLIPIERILARASASASETSHVRRDILEAVASRLGGFELAGYRGMTAGPRALGLPAALAAADDVLAGLVRLPIHPSLALTALLRPLLDDSDRRKTGAYYTDYRLAQHLVGRLAGRRDVSVIDPASGTGILLVAVGLRLCGEDVSARSSFVRNQVHAADLSDEALQGVALAMASLTPDLDAVEQMLLRLKRIDSLIEGPQAWAREAPNGFELVVGNPPWEKLKITRHEFEVALGGLTHYGADRIPEPELFLALAEEREKVALYRERVTAGLTMQGTGEPDLYKAFLELSLQLAQPGGEIALFVPAGLIRSQGTEALRRSLFESTSHLGFTVFENRARFFAIDTRFKFLAVHATKGAQTAMRALTVRHASGTGGEINVTPATRIARASLATVRPDLSVPELRNRAEWRVFRRMAHHSKPFGASDGIWQPTIVREVDMTRDRPLFARTPGNGRVPVVEGRMVHQHRFGAKAYVSGTGRKAVWLPLPPGIGRIAPQFWIDPGTLRNPIRARCEQTRVGFCDVTGQTNERSVLATRIPAHVVCGNKVPTITFEACGRSAAERDSLSHLWLATANSFALDWFARRVITTSLNYFLLLALPFPGYDLDGIAAQKLVSLGRQLDRANRSNKPDLWELAELRAEIDIRVLVGYGLGPDDLRLMLQDFPLLDRAQPALVGEERSTVTRDFLMTRMAEFAGLGVGEYGERLDLARSLGAVPYFPSEFGSFSSTSGDADEVGYG